MNTTATETKPAIKSGDRILIAKGCAARGVDKGTTARVDDVRELGADYSHSVRVSFTMLNGFKSGKSFVFFARHINRLSDVIVSLNDGDPGHTIQIRRKA